MTDDTDTADDEPVPTYPQPSRYAFALVVVLLCCGAFALLVADESVANRLAGYAYLALVVAVVLRFAEFTLGERFPEVVGRLVESTGARARRLPGWHRAVAATRPLRDGLDRVGESDAALLDDAARDGLFLALVLSAVGGLVIALVWWLDPRQAVTAGYLATWAVVVVSLAGASALLAHVRGV